MINDELRFAYLPVVEWGFTCKFWVLQFLFRTKKNLLYFLDLYVWSPLLRYSGISLSLPGVWCGNWSHDGFYPYHIQIIF